MPPDPLSERKETQKSCLKEERHARPDRLTVPVNGLPETQRTGKSERTPASS